MTDACGNAANAVATLTIPQSYSPDCLVPTSIFANRRLLSADEEADKILVMEPDEVYAALSAVPFGGYSPAVLAIAVTGVLSAVVLAVLAFVYLRKKKIESATML